MALALSLSPVIPDALRLEILEMTFGVAVFSLLVQGLSLSGLVKKLGLSEADTEHKNLELAVGRLTMLYGALEELARLHEERTILPEVELRLSAELRGKISDLEAEVERLQHEHGPLLESQMFTTRRYILRAAKSDLMSLMNAGTIGNDVYRELITELDEELDQLRMTGEE